MKISVLNLRRLLAIVATAVTAHAASITTQPTTTTVTAGQTATFTVSATGSGTVSYQWRRHGFPIVGETGASLALTAATRSQADFYDVVVTDTGGSVESDKVRLLVSPTAYPPVVRFDQAAAVFVEDANGTASVNDMTLAVGGKVVAVGNFAGVDGRRRPGVVRLNADNTVDDTFSPPRIEAGLINQVAAQADGKVLIAGDSIKVAGGTAVSLARLNADGSLDTGFTAVIPFASFEISSLALSGNGKIWVGLDGGRLVRLNANGSTDLGFTTLFISQGQFISALLPLADGRLLVGGGELQRLNADGTVDATFTPNVALANPGVNAIRLQSDGKIIIGGGFSSVGGKTRAGLARLSADGVLDETFAPQAGYVTAFDLQTDGKIVMVGYATATNTTAARFNTNGSVDTSFAPSIQGPGGVLQSVLNTAIVARADGTLVLGGGFTTVNTQPRKRLAVFNADGTLNAGLSGGVRAAGTVSSLVPGTGGSLYLTGTFTHLNGQAHSSIARLTAGGAVDATFNPVVTGPIDISFPTQLVNTLTVQGDGKIVIGGYFDQVGSAAHNGIARLNTDGSVDAAFAASVTGTQARVYSLAVQFDRRIVAGGYFTAAGGQARNGLARFNEDGTIDPSFAPVVSAAAKVRALALQADGKLIVGGQFTTMGGATVNNLARINADGTADGTFAAGLSAGAIVNALALLPDGKVVVGHSGLVRLKADGSADATFNSTFAFGSNPPLALLPQEDGALWVAGKFDAAIGFPQTARLIRVGANGALDAGMAFDSSAGNFLTIDAIALNDAGQIWVGGRETSGGSLARLISADAPFFTVQPMSQSVAASGSVTFTATAVSTLPVSYQWSFDGAAISGATNASLVIDPVTSASAGTYAVTATNSAGSVTSDTVTLTVAGPFYTGIYFGTTASGGNWALYVRSDNSSTYLAYLPARHSVVKADFTVSAAGAFSQTGSEVTAGTAASFTLTGQILPNGAVSGQLTGLGETFTGAADTTSSGQGFAGYYSATALGTATGGTYAIIGGSGQTVVVVTSRTVPDGISGTISPAGTISGTMSNGAMLALTLNPSTQKVAATVTPSGSGTPIRYSGLTDGVAPVSRVVNLSVRSNAGTGDQTLIVGFVIVGSGNKTLLARGVGPGISAVVPTALTDPRLRLLDRNAAEVEANNDWDASLTTTFASLGASPLEAGSKDAAIYRAIPGGVYSVHVLSNTSANGVALAEIYDGDANPVPAQVVNISARTQVGTGSDVLIAGFVITGNSPKTLLIRGLGPSLTLGGVTSVLLDPQLSLYKVSDLITTNDNWGGTAELKAAGSTVGAGALIGDNSKDAALLVTLEPGVYSAVVSGVGSTTGIGLVEIFLMP